MAIELNVNGEQRDLGDIDPNTPLLWALRDHLGLLGTKYGCGEGACGSCTVHVNGQAIRSCMMPVAALADAKIVTIEGLAQGGELTPLQQAWCDHDVAQCGYCQSGQIMSASALLARTPQPSDSEIAAAISGNLCRCGTYPRIKKAIHAAAQSQTA